MKLHYYFRITCQILASDSSLLIRIDIRESRKLSNKKYFMVAKEVLIL